MFDTKVISDNINRAVKMVTSNHPLSIEAVVYRKERVTNDGSDPETIGGAGVLGGIGDESNYELTCQGTCHVKFVDRTEWGEIAGDGSTYSGQTYRAMIAPCNEGEFTIQKYDRIYLVLPHIQLSYEVQEIDSTLSLINGRTEVYLLQPLEQSVEWPSELI